MQERVFMGMGSKPFMDIQPSEAAICDRAVKCALPGRECKAAASSGVSAPPGDNALPRPDSIGSGSSSSMSGSHSSSSSGRGSLPPTGFLCGQPQEREEGHRDFPGSGGLEDDDLDREKIQLLMDSSESSGESVSGFSGSDRSCLSVIGGDADDTSSIASTLRPKAGHALGTAHPPEPRTGSSHDCQREIDRGLTCCLCEKNSCTLKAPSGAGPMKAQLRYKEPIPNSCHQSTLLL
ncbi:hypothetical protein SKAU_G00096530 [Synaphobranchus kaupii]|uniref:Uncharacterized protein n=1 Tax=Synaphobranchus kaupii TaxID=118154 RepID=A0A9Q1FYM1_SYNKA|nr:hypothetical protein SKAU_G00096530 [Synaphobranchus kaupii]